MGRVRSHTVADDRVDAALAGLRARLAAAALPLPLAGVDEAVRTRDEALAQLDDYVVPRLADAGAPLLAVLGGSTGAGKSTLANSLVGVEVSEPGVLRPTTRAPVLVCHPEDAGWFLGDRILGGLPRTTGERPSAPGSLHIVRAAGLPRGLALLDSPDIDSIVEAHHELAAQLLGAADLWLFVTTAARYADAVPWAYLARAKERAVALAVILNRVPPGALRDVPGDLRRRLAEHGLGDATLFVVPEEALDDGLIGAAVEPVRSWLAGLVADAATRRAVVLRTLDGVLASYPARAGRVAVALEQQGRATSALREASTHAYAEAQRTVDVDLGDGALLRGEVLDRFREHVGTALWMDRLQRAAGRALDRLRGRDPVEAQARGALGHDLATLVGHAADGAAAASVAAWSALPGGAALLARGNRLDRAGEDLPAAIAAEVEAWQDAVLDLVRTRAGAKMAVARGLSVGVNAVGTALMVVVFAHTGGLTGAELVVAGGTATVSQALLTAVFGEQAVRDLARQARDDLRTRIHRLLAAERARFDDLLAMVPGEAAAATLRQAAAELDVARAR